MRIIDLTHTIKEDMPVYPGTEPPSLAKANTIESDGFAEVLITMYSHTGTHIDAPCHMIAGAKSLSDFDAGKFVGRACVLDFSDVEAAEIGLSDILSHESKISQADFVVIRTGWDKYWGSKSYFEGFPVLSSAAARWLAAFDLKGVGVDAISVDSVGSESFDAHFAFMEKEIIIIENLANLGCIENEFFTLSVLPLKLQGADGSPVRAVAIECT